MPELNLTSVNVIRECTYRTLSYCDCFGRERTFIEPQELYRVLANGPAGDYVLLERPKSVYERSQQNE